MGVIIETQCTCCCDTKERENGCRKFHTRLWLFHGCCSWSGSLVFAFGPDNTTGNHYVTCAEHSSQTFWL